MTRLLLILLVFPMISFGENDIWTEIKEACSVRGWGADSDYYGKGKEEYCDYIANTYTPWVIKYPELFYGQPNNQNIPIQPPPCSIGLEDMPCVQGM